MPTVPGPSRRRPALDSLRGVAALVVVVHHCLLTSPPLANGYGGHRLPTLGSWSGLLLYTPLHLVWAGGEAVLVFFVLSGLVLSLPHVGGTAVRWRAYYAQRLLRLYAPLIVATTLSLAVVNAVPRHAGPWSSWWTAAHTSPVGLREAAHDAVLVRGTTWMNSAFWSLRWEVWFSLLLPVVLLPLLGMRRAPALQLAALAAVSAAGSRTGHQALTYLPIFGLGVVMAQQWSRLLHWGNDFGSLRATTRRDVWMGTGLLLTAQWWLMVLPAPLSGLPYLAQAGMVLTLAGACVLIWLFGTTESGGRLGKRPELRWLGRRSFSLYLVHEPIVVSMTYLLHGTGGAGLVLVFSVPVCLALAEGFGRVIEAPSHRLARAVGRWCDTGH